MHQGLIRFLAVPLIQFRRKKNYQSSIQSNENRE
jgi:hypothetical protein